MYDKHIFKFKALTLATSLILSQTAMSIASTDIAPLYPNVDPSKYDNQVLTGYHIWGGVGHGQAYQVSNDILVRYEPGNSFDNSGPGGLPDKNKPWSHTFIQGHDAQVIANNLTVLKDSNLQMSDTALGGKGRGYYDIRNNLNISGTVSVDNGRINVINRVELTDRGELYLELSRTARVGSLVLKDDSTISGKLGASTNPIRPDSPAMIYKEKVIRLYAKNNNLSVAEVNAELFSSDNYMKEGSLSNELLTFATFMGGSAKQQFHVHGTTEIRDNAEIKMGGIFNAHGQFTLANTARFKLIQGELILYKGGEINGQLDILEEEGDIHTRLVLKDDVLNINTDQKYAGVTSVEGGELHLNNIKLEDSKVLIAEQGKVIAHGNSLLATVENKGQLFVGNAFDASEKYGTTTITGDYTGIDNSEIHFGTIAQVPYGEETHPLALNGRERSSAAHYKNVLLIKGNATGNSQVVITKIAEVNGKRITPKGILLVHVEGQSDLNLTLKNRLTSGGTEYLLKGRENLDSLVAGKNSWYLANTKDVELIEPVFESILKAQPIIAPENGAYLSNLIVANEMYKLKYSDRLYFDKYDGVWGNVSASYMKFETNFGKELNNKIDFYNFRLGKDLWHDNEMTVGIMGTYGYSKGRTRSNYTGYKADHNSQGFALGVYGSYRFNEDKGYVDSWVQYAHNRSEVEGEGLRAEKYNSKGFLASLEVGYNYAATDAITLTPQAQVIWSNVKANAFEDYQGTKISGNHGNVQSRLGARVAYEGSSAIPYVEVNYVHNSKTYATNFSDLYGNNINTSLAGSKNIYQLELGVSSKPSNGWRATGAISYAGGEHAYENASVKVDVRYDF